MLSQLQQSIFLFIPVQSWLGITLLILVKCLTLWTNETNFLARWPNYVILCNWTISSICVALSMNSSWGTVEHTGMYCKSDVQSITKKHIPPFFQPFVFHVYLRNRLRYNKFVYIFLHPFLKSFQLEQEFFTFGDIFS